MQIRELFDEFPFPKGQIIPLEMQQLLREELIIGSDWDDAEARLLQARSVMPERLEILVALYKLYAYSNRFEESIETINALLLNVATERNLPMDWRQLSPDSANWKEAEGSLRFYLYSMKATGFVRLRQGKICEAMEVLDKLLDLDTQDLVGGSVVHQMATRLMGEEGD